MLRRNVCPRWFIVSGSPRRAVLLAGASIATLLTAASGAAAATLGGGPPPGLGTIAPAMPGAQQAARTAGNVESALRRATIAIQAMQAAQQAARDAARLAPTNVPNGLRPD